MDEIYLKFVKYLGLRIFTFIFFLFIPIALFIFGHFTTY